MGLLAGSLGLYALFTLLENRDLREAEIAFAGRNYWSARRSALEALQDNPDSSRALLLIGLSAARIHNTQEAIAYLSLVPDDGGRDAALALENRGWLLYQTGRLSDGEQCLRKVISRDRGNISAREKLVSVYLQTGRYWKARRHVVAMLRRGHFHPKTLVLLCDWGRTLNIDDKFLEMSLHAVPDDPLPLLAQAIKHLGKNEAESARPQLERLVRERPEVIAAQVQLGKLLWDSGLHDEFVAWESALPDEANHHPQTWYLRGLWASSHNQFEAAARCQWEAIRKVDHPGALSELATLLFKLNKAEQAKLVAERARLVSDISYQVNIRLNRSDLVLDSQIPRFLTKLGRRLEAAAWCWASIELLAHSNRQPDSLDQTRRRMRELSPGLAVADATACEAFANRVNLSGLPLPEISDSNDLGTSEPPPAESKLANTVRFENQAVEAGLDFTYLSGIESDSDRDELYLYDGGGIGVMDFDRDGRPDLYITQGGEWPRQPDSPENDRVFQNIDGRQFADVTDSVGIDSRLYGQGVTIGDFNNDGFPDVYVANIGPNRLFENNGDGTFSAVDVAAMRSVNVWTSSCLLADLNSDGLPDIFDVNYLGGDILTRQCFRTDDFLCSPVHFPAEQDRLYLNMGNGEFMDVTQDCGIVAPSGKGLGIVAADFNHSGRLSLFIANDETPNFYFVNRGNQEKGPISVPQFSEQARLTGLACDRDGSVQSCMGVAAGDITEDGHIDLFVTNFYEESNTLYSSQPDFSFADRTRQAHLRNPGFKLLGFGTQFLDGDLDGDLDLVVTNGHVLPFIHEAPGKMPPQYYENQRGGEFELVPSSRVGDYFAKKYFGRSLARLDWNTDGRDDFCVLSLDDPVALLTNTSDNPRGSVTLMFCGVDSARDAIGVRVEVKIASRTRTFQLTAGDGYQVSNDRCITIGLGEAQQIDSLDVTWPSGARDILANVARGRRLMLIENSSQALPIFTH